MCSCFASFVHVTFFVDCLPEHILLELRAILKIYSKVVATIEKRDFLKKRNLLMKAAQGESWQRM